MQEVLQFKRKTSQDKQEQRVMYAKKKHKFIVWPLLLDIHKKLAPSTLATTNYNNN